MNVCDPRIGMDCGRFPHYCHARAGIEGPFFRDTGHGTSCAIEWPTASPIFNLVVSFIESGKAGFGQCASVIAGAAVSSLFWDLAVSS
jgi:hypothetical protein